MGVPMISDGHGRMVKEWIADHPDQKIPDRVRLRIWLREDGIDYLTGRKIRPGEQVEYEHVIALCNGGQHRESNIRLTVKGKAHKEKTARDRKIKKRGDAAAKRHAGIKKPSRMPGGRDSNIKIKMDGTIVDRRTGLPIERGQR